MSDPGPTQGIQSKPRYQTRKFWKDFAERVGSTVAYAVIAYLITVLPTADVPVYVTLGIIPVLSFFKNLLGKKIGNNDSASWNPNV
jgi:hypothetical protein